MNARSPTSHASSARPPPPAGREQTRATQAGANRKSPSALASACSAALAFLTSRNMLAHLFLPIFAPVSEFLSVSG
jgi:hypothetical protein